MEFHNNLIQSADYRTFAESKKFAAECVHFSRIKLSLLSVLGTVDAPNPGAHPRLVEARPGINPRILILNLVFDQEPGVWNPVVTPKPVGYVKALLNCDVYDQVTINGYETVEIVKTEV